MTFRETKVTKKGRIKVKTKGYDAVKVSVVVRTKPKPGFHPPMETQHLAQVLDPQVTRNHTNQGPHRTRCGPWPVLGTRRVPGLLGWGLRRVIAPGLRSWQPGEPQDAPAVVIGPCDAHHKDNDSETAGI